MTNRKTLIRRDRKAKSTTFYSGSLSVEVTRTVLSRLKSAAAKDRLGRSRLCLHRGPEDRVQEMILVFCRGSYVRPHRHPGKAESFHLIEGELDVVFFDQKGRLVRRVRLSGSRERNAFCCRFDGTCWHTVVPRTRFTVVHETTSGPFDRAQRDHPCWAPEDNDLPAVKAFMAYLRGPG